MNYNKTASNAIMIMLIAIAVTTFTSCKKKDTPAATGTFYFHLHTNIDTNEVDNVTALYRDASGRHFGLSTAQFYISGIMLKNANGSMYTVVDAYVLKDINNEEYLIGTAPIGTYTSVMFNVGVDAAANATTPSSHPSASPLSNASMWYGNTTQGYMFMKIQGFADTTAGQTGTGLVHFSYEIGSSANLKTVTMPTRSGALAPYVLTKDGTQFIHVNCDYGKLLSDINFKTQDSTDSYTLNPSVATTIVNNIPNLFEYED